MDCQSISSIFVHHTRMHFFSLWLTAGLDRSSNSSKQLDCRRIPRHTAMIPLMQFTPFARHSPVMDSLISLPNPIGFQRYGFNWWCDSNTNGYEAQGSNWGTNISGVWFVKILLVSLKSTLTLPLTVPDLEAFNDIVDKERDAVSTIEYAKEWKPGYCTIQSTRSRLIGCALNNSPVGLRMDYGRNFMRGRIVTVIPKMYWHEMKYWIINRFASSKKQRHNQPVCIAKAWNRYHNGSACRTTILLLFPLVAPSFWKRHSGRLDVGQKNVIQILDVRTNWKRGFILDNVRLSWVTRRFFRMLRQEWIRQLRLARAPLKIWH